MKRKILVTLIIMMNSSLFASSDDCKTVVTSSLEKYTSTLEIIFDDLINFVRELDTAELNNEREEIVSDIFPKSHETRLKAAQTVHFQDISANKCANYLPGGIMTSMFLPMDAHHNALFRLENENLVVDSQLAELQKRLEFITSLFQITPGYEYTENRILFD